ncbi:MAG: radical SAM family heme chaperone HemW [Buchnera aphidicola (Nurudea yanoniella)]
MTNLPKLSLYIHIPWCKKICSYCDFNVFQKNRKIEEDKYIKHLLQDLKNDVVLSSKRKIETIFIGGGSPGLFKKTSIKYLLDSIKEIILISKSAEITIELNPTISELNKFLHYKYSGINRFSIGIHNVNNNQLKILKNLKNFTIKNVNLNLMYGLPQQTLKKSLLDLNKIIDLNSKHISWYPFYLEPKNSLYYKKIKLPDHDIMWNMYKKGEQKLKKAGYTKYAISEYSKKKYKCRHNLNYWRFGDYLGIGCGAHGKITQNNGNIIRTIKEKNPKKFMYTNYIYKKYIVPKHQLPYEFFSNYFRLYEQIPKNNFKKYTNIEEYTIQNEIKKSISQKYLIETKKYWKTTKKGKLFLDSFLKLFIK